MWSFMLSTHICFICIRECINIWFIQFKLWHLALSSICLKVWRQREAYTHVKRLRYQHSFWLHQDVCVTHSETFTAWILEERFPTKVNLCHLLSVLLTFSFVTSEENHSEAGFVQVSVFKCLTVISHIIKFWNVIFVLYEPWPTKWVFTEPWQNISKPQHVFQTLVVCLWECL